MNHSNSSHRNIIFMTAALIMIGIFGPYSKANAANDKSATPPINGVRENSPPLPVLTVQNAASMALKQNPEIQEAREKLEQAASQYDLAKSLLYPTWTASMIGNYKKDATNGLSSPFSGNPYNSYLFDTKLSETAFFGITAGIQMPKKDRQLTEIALLSASRNLTGKVIASFYKVILDEKLLEALLQTESVQRESLATAEHRYRIGRGQLLDVLQVKTQLALLAPQIAQARSQIQNDASQLTSYLGTPDSREVRLRGELVVIPPSVIEAQTKNIQVGFPELEQADVNLERLQLDREVTLGKNFPSLSAIFDWNRSAFAKTDLLDSASTAWAFSLQLNIPLFSGLSSLQQRRIYASQNTQLELAREGVRNNLTLQQIQSRKNLAVSWETISSTQDAFKLAGASLKEAKKNYQLATIDFLQYLSVQQAYLQAKSSSFQAEYNYINSLIGHFIASGLPLNRLIDLLEENT